MYSYEDRKKAVKLYSQYGLSYASVKRELGYPSDHKTLVAWYNDYKQNGWKPKAVSKYSKYSAKQRRIAIDHYYKHGRCVSRTVRMLGYPSRTLLKEWLVQAHPEDFPDCSPNASLI